MILFRHDLVIPPRHTTLQLQTIVNKQTIHFPLL